MALPVVIIAIAAPIAIDTVDTVQMWWGPVVPAKSTVQASLNIRIPASMTGYSSAQVLIEMPGFPYLTLRATPNSTAWSPFFSQGVPFQLILANPIPLNSTTSFTVRFSSSSDDISGIVRASFFGIGGTILTTAMLDLNSRTGTTPPL